MHIHCDAHALNLVVCDPCTSIPALSLFGLVEKLAVFFRDSYKRMDAWRDMIVKCKIGTTGQKRLQMISNTRWSSKSRALTCIFGSFQDSDSSVYLVVICCLTYLLHSNSQNQSTRTQAAELRDKLLGYRVILTAMVFLSMFRFLTPLSDYLQTAGMDYAQAWVQIENAVLMLREHSRKFSDIKIATDKFVEVINSQLTEEWALEGVIVEDCLPKQRTKARRRMDGENARDDIGSLNELKKFEVTVYNSVYDTALQSLEKRFAAHKKLYKYLLLICPSRFEEIGKATTRVSLTGLLDIFGHHISEPESLEQELVTFANNWPSFKNCDLFPQEDDSSENSDNLESEVDNAAEEIRLIREQPNGDNLAFGNESTQPMPHESNTANDDHEETEDNACDDGESHELSGRGRFIRGCKKGKRCVIITCIRLLIRTCIRYTNWL